MTKYALFGISRNSRTLLKLITLLGIVLSLFFLLLSFVYFVYKLLFWNSFDTGLAPILIGSFFFNSIQLLFLGIISQNLIEIKDQALKRPHVVEKERINFDL